MDVEREWRMGSVLALNQSTHRSISQYTTTQNADLNAFTASVASTVCSSVRLGRALEVSKIYRCHSII